MYLYTVCVLCTVPISVYCNGGRIFGRSNNSPPSRNPPSQGAILWTQTQGGRILGRQRIRPLGRLRPGGRILVRPRIRPRGRKLYEGRLI